MADISVSIPVSAVSYKSWLNSSYIATSVRDGEGNSLINELELGPDQEDAFNDMADEASREVLKIFMGRQGDATGVPFEKDATNIIYRFNEAEPALPQALAIKSSLTEDTKNAIYTYIAFLWFKMKGNDGQAEFLFNRYNKITNNIDRHLYKLHD